MRALPGASAAASSAVLRALRGADRVARDVKERWVTPLVGSQVSSAEVNVVTAAMVMNRQVNETLITTVADLVPHELCCQHPVPPTPGDKVNAILGQEQLSSK